LGFTLQMEQALFKLVIFGDGGVGKTTLVQKYLTGIFAPDTRLTVGVDFHLKKLLVDNIEVKLQIWDFAGEDRFRFLLPSYLRGASGGIFMYDITRFTSIKNLDNWLEVLNTDPNFTNVPLILVGGKADLEHKRSVDQDYAYNIAKEKGFLGFAECSAKTGENVEEIFEAITKVMLQKSGMI